MTLREHLLAQARIARRRDELMPGRANTEPCWNMLCALADGLPVSVSSLCYASHAPATTALRHIDLLADEALIDRRPALDDRRRAYLTITDRGMALVCGVFDLQLNSAPSQHTAYEAARTQAGSVSAPAFHSSPATHFPEHACGDTHA